MLFGIKIPARKLQAAIDPKTGKWLSANREFAKLLDLICPLSDIDHDPALGEPLARCIKRAAELTGGETISPPPSPRSRNMIY